MRVLLIICAFLLPLPLLAQFDGGPGDGFDQKQESAISLSGSTISFAGFGGGSGDGFDMTNQFSMSLSGSAVTFNGFNGGSGDGFDMQEKVTTSLSGINISFSGYAGGTGDGFDVKSENLKTLSGATITYGGFNGGVGDGFAFIQQSGLILQNTPLTIYWIDFDAKQQQQIVLLDWEMVSTEDDILHFEIERSRDAIHFEKIGELKTKASVDNKYLSYDREPMMGDNYYRIKYISNDGEIRYTQVRKVIINELVSDLQFRVFPNPNTSRRLYSKVSNILSDESYTLNIYNQQGARVKTIEITNDTIIELPASWSQGLYWVEAIVNDISIKQGVIIR